MKVGHRQEAKFYLLTPNILERFPSKIWKRWFSLPYFNFLNHISLNIFFFEKAGHGKWFRTCGCFNIGCPGVLDTKIMSCHTREVFFWVNHCSLTISTLKMPIFLEKMQCIALEETQRRSIPCLFCSEDFSGYFTIMTILWRTMFSPFCTNGCLGDERFAHLPKIAQPVVIKATFKPMSVKKLYFFSLFNWSSQECSRYLITGKRWGRGSSRKAIKTSCAYSKFSEEAGQLLDVIIPKMVTTLVKNFRGTIWYSMIVLDQISEHPEPYS